MSLIYHRLIFMKTGTFHQHHWENCKADVDSCCQHVTCINVSVKISVCVTRGSVEVHEQQFLVGKVTV